MLKEGKAKKWKSREYVKSAKLPADDHTAYMGELAIGRDTGTLNADGGPCPIIAVYRSDVRLGALLHVCGGDAEVEGDNHEELIGQLLTIEGEIAEHAVCHVILDEVPMPGLNDEKEERKQARARRKNAQRMKAYLQEQGFKKVRIVTDGQGKSVRLNTTEGTLRVIDDEDNTAFLTGY